MNKQQNIPRAFTMIEVVISVSMMTICLVAFTKVVFFVSETQGMLRTRVIAQDQLASVLEMIPARCESGQTPSPTDAMRKLVENALPDGELKFETVPCDKENTIVLKATVSWSDGETQPRKHVSLLRLLHVENP